jgi:hypothetical protein
MRNTIMATIIIRAIIPIIIAAISLLVCNAIQMKL